MALPRILIVEDEAMLRASMVRGLSRLPADVEDAMTVGEAVAALDRAPPDLVISDIDLPDRSGVELIGELGKRALRVPVIFVSAYLRAYRAQIPPHANIDVLEKPVALDELRALIQSRLGQSLATADDAAAPFAATDYVQLACLGHHSVTIEVAGPAGRGVIVIHAGEVWHAEDRRGVGIEAFRRLAFATDAEVRCRTLRHAAGPRSIEARWEALLIDSARVHDEEAYHRAPDGGPTAEPDAGELVDLDRVFDAVVGAPLVAAPPPPPPEPFALAWDRALAAMLARDYPAAVAAFVEARRLRPDDASVAANLERLAALGHPAAEEEPRDDHAPTDRCR